MAIPKLGSLFSRWRRAPASAPPSPTKGGATSRRTIALFAVLGGAGLLAIIALVAGSRIESPADAAARTAPPAPSPILVPIEERVLSTKIVTRGSGRFGLPLPLSISPSALKAAPGLIATLPARNAQMEEGGVLFTASGRPVFALQGKIPAYRDLVPGISGEDVRQLEQALKRLGHDPGAIDGVYDQHTSAAVARWYKAKGWEPFGATRDQLTALATLERDWAEANKAKVTAAAAAQAAVPAVESARATAAHNNAVAESELATKRAELAKFGVSSDKGISQALESERSKADYANKAAEAEVKAAMAERAVIMLDPRQPESARAAAEAKLALAQAAAAKTKLEGELALQTARGESQMVAQRLRLAEGAVHSTRLEGEKNIRAAIDAQKLAELDAKLAAERGDRLAADLEAAKRKIGVQVPVDEIAFIPALPVRIEELKGVIGTPAAGHVLSVTDNQLVIDSSLPLEAGSLVRPGMAVEIDEQALGINVKGEVASVANTPGTRGTDAYHYYLEVRVLQTTVKLEGVSVRVTIPVESTKGAVMAVPSSALALSPDGTSRIQVQSKNALDYVVVKPGLAADGFVEVTPVKGSIAAGQMVVVGYKIPEKTVEPPAESAKPK